MACVHPRRHNSILQSFLWSGNAVSDHVLKSVELELVLCQLRNAHITEIDASNKGFDDADATCIAEALRCDHPARAHVFVRPTDLPMMTRNNCCYMLCFSPFFSVFLTSPSV